jgi:triacylglycerol lipase
MAIDEPIPLISASNRPVLLVHGIDADGTVFHQMAQAFRDVQREVHVISYRPSNGRLGLDRLAEQIEEYVAKHLNDRPHFDLVGFSMGGLVTRYYVQKLGGTERVRRLVTISAPHQGTLLAYLRWNEAGRQMRPGSDFLRMLNGDLAWTNRVEWTSIWTPFDLMIVPAGSSHVAQIRNERIRVLLHPWMLTDGRVIQLVKSILELP